VPPGSDASAVDVLVVGAGPAGCAAAAAASRLGRTVALLHHVPASAGGADARFRIGEGAAPGTPQLIDEIFGNDTHAFTPSVHVRCPSIISAWGGSDPVVSEHMTNPLGVAWNLDRNRFDADLRAGAERLGVSLRGGGQVTKAKRDGAGWTIAFAARDPGPPGARGRVVIDASGRGAHVARQQGARKTHLDRLVALSAVWSVDAHDESSSTYIEAVRRGWWYSVLLPQQRRMVVYLTDADLLPTDARARLSLAESARRLEVIGSALALSDHARIVVGPTLSPARTGWLDRFGGESWLSAGDAACTFDPLSGRGIVAALLSGRAAGTGAASLVAGEDAGAEVGRHGELLATTFVDALAERRDAYRAEMRWPEAEFWSRRHQD
jgi:flavin-dependent dehydrogenase